MIPTMTSLEVIGVVERVEERLEHPEEEIEHHEREQLGDHADAPGREERVEDPARALVARGRVPHRGKGLEGLFLDEEEQRRRHQVGPQHDLPEPLLRHVDEEVDRGQQGRGRGEGDQQPPSGAVQPERRERRDGQQGHQARHPALHDVDQHEGDVRERGEGQDARIHEEHEHEGVVHRGEAQAPVVRDDSGDQHEQPFEQRDEGQRAHVAADRLELQVVGGRVLGNVGAYQDDQGESGQSHRGISGNRVRSIHGYSKRSARPPSTVFRVIFESPPSGKRVPPKQGRFLFARFTRWERSPSARMLCLGDAGREGPACEQAKQGGTI